MSFRLLKYTDFHDDKVYLETNFYFSDKITLGISKSIWTSVSHKILFSEGPVKKATDYSISGLPYGNLDLDQVAKAQSLERFEFFGKRPSNQIKKKLKTGST